MDESDVPLAPLYGRADHQLRGDGSLSPGERVSLALRACYLLAVFAPFVLLGSVLLLLAHLLGSRRPGPATPVRASTAQESHKLRVK